MNKGGHRRRRIGHGTRSSAGPLPRSIAARATAGARLVARRSWHAHRETFQLCPLFPFSPRISERSTSTIGCESKKTPANELIGSGHSADRPTALAAKLTAASLVRELLANARRQGAVIAATASGMAPGQALDRFLDQLRRVPRQALAFPCRFIAVDAHAVRLFIRSHGFHSAPGPASDRPLSQIVR